MAFQSSAGLEIREDGASAVILKASMSGPRIAGRESFSFQADIPTEEKARAAGEFLRSFLKKHGGSSAFVYVAIPRHWSLNRFVEAPSVIKENLREALGFEMDKYLPFPSEALWYDYEILSEDQEKIKILLTAVKRDKILPYFDTPGGLGRSVSGLETVSSAISNAYMDLSGTRREGLFSLLYQRNGRIEISVLEGERLVFSRSLAISAEELEGSLLMELKKAHEAVGAPDGDIKTVCVSEGAARRALEALKERGALAELMEGPETGKIMELEMLPAYGAALRGLKKLPLDVNLLPAELMKKASKSPLYFMYLMAFLVVIAASAWGVGHVIKQRAELNKLNLQAKVLASEAEAVQKVKQEIAALESRIKFLEDFRAKRGAVILLLKELTERIPKSAWISNMNLSEKGVEIEGYADSASELIPLLDKSPMFKDVGFLSSITKAQGKERFRIGLKQVPEGLAAGRKG